MKNKIIIIVQFLAILLIVGFIFYTYDRPNKKNSLTLYGNVDIRQVDLSFRVEGKVSDVLVEEGDSVKSGDLLAKLDPTPLQEELSITQADLQTKLILLQQTESKLKRRESTAEGAVSIEELEDYYYEKLSLESQIEETKAKIALNITHVEDTQLISPSSGMIITRIREPGSVLKIGEPVVTLSLDKPIWIRAFISETELGLIYPGMKALVFTDANPSKGYEGQIGFISPVAEFTPKTVETPDLRTQLVYRLRIIIGQPDQYLRQGMPVTVKIALSGSTQEN